MLFYSPCRALFCPCPSTHKPPPRGQSLLRTFACKNPLGRLLVTGTKDIRDVARGLRADCGNPPGTVPRGAGPPRPLRLCFSKQSAAKRPFLLLYSTVFPRILWHFIKATRRWYCPLSRSEINPSFIASGNAGTAVRTVDGFSQLQDLWSILYLHPRQSLIYCTRCLCPPISYLFASPFLIMVNLLFFSLNSFSTIAFFSSSTMIQLFPLYFPVTPGLNFPMWAASADAGMLLVGVLQGAALPGGCQLQQTQHPGCEHLSPDAAAPSLHPHLSAENESVVTVK